MGLGCLLSLCVASRAWAEGEEAAAVSAKEDERPAPQRIAGSLSLAPPETSRTLLPPYMRDVRGNVTTTALFPLYFDRLASTQHERFVLPYYYRRSAKLNIDVALGLVWSLRGPQRNTLVLPPLLYTHRNGKSWGFGLMPLFSTGVFQGHHHTTIPPLLTWIDGDDKRRHTLIGPYFDWRFEQKRFWGVFPLLWDKSDEVDRFTLVPPVFFRFADDDPVAYTTVVPPALFFHKRRKDDTRWGVIPLVFHKKTPELRALTIPFALFHHATGPKEFRLITPVMGHLHDEKSTSWYTPLYQRRRGDKNFDAVAPLYVRTWDDRDMSRGLFLPPIYWHWRDPANDSLTVFPFVSRNYHDGIGKMWLTPLIGHAKSFERAEQSWWVAPTFHYAEREQGWQFNIHPLFYLKRETQERHLALAPLYFDFRNREKKTHRFTLFPLWWNFKNYDKQTFARAAFPLYWDFENVPKQRRRTIGFPLWWDIRNGQAQSRTRFAFPLYLRLDRGTTERTFVLNSYYEQKAEPAAGSVPGKRSWQYHFFPLVSLGGGERGKESDAWWNFLYGFAGYERRGEHKRIRALWIPITLK